MKRLLLQVNVKLDDHKGFARFRPNQDIYKLSEYRAKIYAKKWNVEYHQITDCDYLPDKHPTFQRFKMYEWDYDEILYLDMDAIILPNCPNPFEVLSGNIFSAVRDRPWNGSKRKPKEYYDEVRAKFNKAYGAKENYKPFCAGVMFLTKEFLNKTRNLWRDYLYSFDKSGNGIDGGHDQAILNTLVVQKLDGKYNELGEEWGPWYRQGTYIEHIGGTFKKSHFNLEHFCKKYNISLDDFESIDQDVKTENSKKVFPDSDIDFQYSMFT